MLARSHLFTILLIIKIVIIIVIIIIGLILLLGLLNVRDCLPLFGEFISFGFVISDDDVVEDGTTLHLPEIKTDEAEVCVFVDTVIILEFRVVNLPGCPHTLVSRVGDALYKPLALEIWIVLHWSLPFTILLIIPILRLLGVGIHDTLLLDPIVWLLVFWIINHGVIRPIF